MYDITGINLTAGGAIDITLYKGILFYLNEKQHLVLVLSLFCLG